MHIKEILIQYMNTCITFDTVYELLIQTKIKSKMLGRKYSGCKMYNHCIP